VREREFLLPIGAAKPFDLSWTEARRVHRDCHVSYGGNRYSVPFEHGNQSVLVRRQPDGVLLVERNGMVIARHVEVTGSGGTVTTPSHVAGLWSKTLGRKRTYAVPAPEAPGVAVASLPECVSLPSGAFAVDVQRRDLMAYQAFLEDR
jgi:hypothetical protein